MRPLPIYLLLVLAIAACAEQPGTTAAQLEQASEPAKHSASLQAAVVMQSGDVKPAARMSIHITKVNIIQTLDRQTEIRAIPETEGLGFSQHAVSYAWTKQYSAITEGGYSQYRNEFSTFLDSLTIQQVTTDFEGKVTLPSMPTGEYHLFAYAPLGRTGLVWSETFSLGADTSFVWDQNNAVYAF